MIDDALQPILTSRSAEFQGVDYDDGIDMRRIIAARDDGRIDLVDHSWLAGEPGANPLDSKQGKPPLDMQDELASIWIEDRPQGGAWLVPVRDKGPDVAVSRRAAKPGEIAAHLARASRLLHMGKSLDSILPELVVRVGERVARIAAKSFRDDEGLVGRVYIRESVFPGLRQGRWDGLVRRMAQQARYLVSSQPADGFRKFGLEVVAEVPWDQALRLYEPHVASRDVRIAGDPKEVLRRAMIANPGLRPASRRVPASDPAPSRAPAKAPAPAKSPEQLDHEVRVRMAHKLVRLSVRKGRLTAAEGEELIASGRSPEELRVEMDRRAAAPRKVGAYGGVADKYGSEQQAVRNMALRPSEAASAPKNHARAQLRKRVAQLLLRGAMTPADARRILSIQAPTPAYGGDGVNFDPRHQAARDLSLVQFSGGEELQGRLRQRASQNAEVPQDRGPAQLRKRVAQMLLRGEVDSGRARQILASKDGWGALARYLASPGQLPQHGPPQSVVKQYQGHAHRAGGTYLAAKLEVPTAEEAAFARAAAAAGCAPADVSKYVKWFRGASSRGLSPEILDHEASLRFPQQLRQACQEIVAGIHEKLREREEGKVPPPHHDPHESAFIHDAGWNPGGSR